MERRACSNPFIRLVGRVRTGFTLDPVNPVLNKRRGEQMNHPRDYGGEGEDWLHPGPREPRPEQGKG